MTFRHDPERRDSGIGWVGEIPEHWEIRKLKYLAHTVFSSVDKNSADGELAVRLCNYVDVYYNDVITAELPFMEATATPSEVAKFRLQRGDVLITKDSESWEDIAVPAYVTSESHGVLCGCHLARVRPNEKLVDGAYLFRSFAARGINDQFRVAATGITRFGLGKYWLDNALFLVPPIAEQRAIAAFLDRETARIDALIEKKQRQIALLEEKRIAVISHAVTKGLDPNVPMKDSGVDWLRQVPSHWGICQLKYAATFQRGHDLRDSDFRDGPVPVVSSAGITGRHNESRSKGPGIVTGRYGTIGSFHYVEEDFWPHNTTLYCINTRGNHVRFLWYLLQNISSLFLVNAGKSAVPGVDRNDLHPILVAIPPLEEQRNIARFLDRETDQIEKLQGRIKDSIALLREYRSALISAAVTGKIDVREEVA